MERVWWGACGGERVVGSVWWGACGGEGVVGSVWWGGGEGHPPVWFSTETQWREVLRYSSNEVNNGLIKAAAQYR